MPDRGAPTMTTSAVALVDLFSASHVGEQGVPRRASLAVAENCSRQTSAARARMPAAVACRASHPAERVRHCLDRRRPGARRPRPRRQRPGPARCRARRRPAPAAPRRGTTRSCSGRRRRSRRASGSPSPRSAPRITSRACAGGAVRQQSRPGRADLPEPQPRDAPGRALPSPSPIRTNRTGPSRSSGPSTASVIVSSPWYRPRLPVNTTVSSSVGRVRSAPSVAVVDVVGRDVEVVDDHDAVGEIRRPCSSSAFLMSEESTTTAAARRQVASVQAQQQAIDPGVGELPGQPADLGMQVHAVVDEAAPREAWRRGDVAQPSTTGGAVEHITTSYRRPRSTRRNTSRLNRTTLRGLRHRGPRSGSIAESPDRDTVDAARRSAAAGAPARACRTAGWSAPRTSWPAAAQCAVTARSSDA